MFDDANQLIAELRAELATEDDDASPYSLTANELRLLLAYIDALTGDAQARHDMGDCARQAGEG